MGPVIGPWRGTQHPWRKGEAPTRPSLQASRTQTRPGEAPPSLSRASLGHMGERAWGHSEEQAGCVGAAGCPPSKPGGPSSLQGFGDDARRPTSCIAATGETRVWSPLSSLGLGHHGPWDQRVAAVPWRIHLGAGGVPAFWSRRLEGLCLSPAQDQVPMTCFPPPSHPKRASEGCGRRLPPRMGWIPQVCLGP